ncbi:stem-specific protein TSJT1-like [Telopea speciosissima]|uniref:stem-specific protein TSJT1-like n=1 Tax=Telopea speciosissima TaxID=54955 RepID=UPI001CC49381|nr:stem-specific protein TSJT1-like [Telopea speciosissima]XP_043688696.1 stem-specific protein TSJT1-like [Telopea speciosissima]
MLAIFNKTVAHPPKELHSPDSSRTAKKSNLISEEILKDFLSSHPDNAFSMSFNSAAVLAYVRPDRIYSPHNQRLFCGYDEIYCVFMGSLSNLCSLIRQYGLTKNTNEAMLVIEAYRTLRDRGPYPADQVIKDLDGSFAFVVFDSKDGTVFAALSSDGGVKLHWGIAEDDSVVISDDLKVIKTSCGKSFAPFPTGCMFHSGGGLTSFEHPMNKVKAMPRVDSEGVMCGSIFKVDVFSRNSTMPRVGSEANWAAWNSY